MVSPAEDARFSQIEGQQQRSRDYKDIIRNFLKGAAIGAFFSAFVMFMNGKELSNDTKAILIAFSALGFGAAWSVSGYFTRRKSHYGCINMGNESNCERVCKVVSSYILPTQG